MNDELLTIQQAAALLGVSTKTLRRWEAKGHLTPQRTIGNQRRYSKAELTTLFQDVRGKAKIQSLPRPEQVATESYVEAMPVDFAKTESLVEESPIDVIEDTIEKPTRSFRGILFAGAVFAIALCIGVMSMLIDNQQGLQKGLGFFSGKTSSEMAGQQVLAANNAVSAFQLNVNVPGIFGKKVKFLDAVSISKGLQVGGIASLSGGIITNNANANLGTGKLTASNVVYSLVAGTNITISGNKQNPTISAGITGGVTSLEGATGAVSLTNGSGISLNGLQINNSGVLTVQGQSGNVTFTGGGGIGISGTTISNTDAGSAQNIFKTFSVDGTDIAAGSNNDTINFAAGSGITLVGDAGSKTITITNSGSTGGLSGLTTNGVLYATSTTTAGTVVGTNGTVLHGVTGGAPIFSSVDLTADVANILPLGNGGTGLGTINPGNGQILIGNGSGYQLATITQGAGLGVANGAGSITLSNTGVTSAVAGSGIGVSGGTGAVTITNNGVLSLTGTANEVNVSGSTGAVVLSLPQDIATTSTPTFASLTLGASSNQLTLGTGNTATITTATLTIGHTYTLPDGSGTFCLVELNNCSGGGGGGIGGSGSQFYIPIFTGSTSVGDSDIYDNGKIGIGTTSPEGLFSVSGTSPGFALAELNQTGSESILTGSASGVTRFVFDSSGNLNIIGGAYQIGGANVLSSTTLGSSVVNSSLTSVGALNVGSITSGFGSIDVGTDTIAGGDITSSGTTGLTATGNGAGLTFSGSGNHIVSASSGTLELGATTLTGAISGGGQNITGLGTVNGLAITADTGTITSGKWNATAIGALYGGTGINTSGSTGVPYISGGIWSVDANSLAATHGGTGQTGYAVGDLLYADTTTTLARLPVGSSGKVLTVSGGVPVWSNAGGTINFWQENVGAVEPFDLTDDLLLGSTATASAKFAFENVAAGTPTASISANTANNSTYLTGDGTLATTDKQTLTLGSASTGNVSLFGFGAGVVHTNASGVFSEGLVQNGELQNNSVTINTGTGLSGGAAVALGGTLNLANTGVTSLTGTLNQVNVSGPSGAVTLSLPQSIDSGSSPTFTSLTLSSFTSAGGPLYTNGSGALAQVTAGTAHQVLHGGSTPTFGAVDLTADVTGVLPVANGGTGANLTLSSLNAQGSIPYFNGSGVMTTVAIGGNTTCLTSNGTVPVWASCSGVGTNFFQLNNGAISPLDTGNDFLLGSTATASAKFAFINNATGTPTASISANTANNSLYITGDGILATTDRETLTLGSASTGNVDLFGFGAGVVHTNASGVLSEGLVQNSELQNNSISLSYGTGLSGSASVALGGTLTLNNTGVTSAVAGTGISVSGATGPVTITNTGVTSLTGTLNQVNVSGPSGAVTLSLPQSIDSGSSPTFTSLTLSSFTSAGGPLYTNGSGALAQVTAGTAHQVLHGGLTPSFGAVDLTADVTGILPLANGGTNANLSASVSNGGIVYSTATGMAILAANANSGLALVSGAGGTPSWFAPTQGSLIFAGANGALTQSNSQLFFDNTKNLLGVGTGTPVSKLDVEGLVAGKALSIFNYTGTDQNILVASTSGTEEFAINNNGALQFNGNSGFLNTLNTTGTFSSGQTYSFPNSGGTICILQAGNCAGSGSGVTHTGGGVNQLTYFDSSNDITSSSNLVFTNDLEVTGANGSKAAEILNQLNSGNIFTASASGATEFNINNNGNLQFAGGSNFLNTITTAPSTAARTYTFPDVTGTVCLLEAGNCAGSGSGVTHTGGGVNQLTYFDSSNDITSSSNLVWNNDLEVTGANGSKAALIVNQINSGNILTASASGTTEFTIGHDGTITSGKYTTNNGLLYTNGSGIIAQQAAAGTDAQVLLSNSGTPTFATISGDATISDTGALTLKNVGTSGTYGSASQVPVFTTDAQGRVTGVTNTSIAIDGSQITSGVVSTTNGGTGANLSAASQYSIPYFSAAGVLGGALPPSTAGYVLTTNNTGSAPSWTNAASLGTNYWSQVAGVLSPLTTNNVLAATSSATTVATFTTNNPSGTLANNTLIQNTGAGTITNLLNLTQSAGTVTNAIAINGTVGSALTVGGTPIINGSGLLLSAGLSGTYSNALTLSNVSNSITAGTLTATGGTLDNVAIGSTTQSTAKVTTLGASGTVIFSNATYSATGGLLKAAAGTGQLSIASSVTDYQVPLSFNNGLTNTSNTVQLGGSLTQATSISFGNNNLTLGDNTGTGNLTVSPNAGGQAALIVNKQGGNDIFTASASGATKFVITNGGSLNVVGGQTSDIDTLSGATLTIGGSTQTGLTLGRSGANTTINGSNSGAGLTITPTSWTSTPTISGLITAAGGLTVSSGKNLTLADSSFTTNNNTVLSANGSGVVTPITTTNTGYCLTSNGSGAAPSWQACAGSGTQNFWQSVSGALSPLSETQDLLLGSTATTSAKFAFTGVDGGTPTASISANIGNNATYLTGNGILGTTNGQTLQLGGTGTGNILLQPGASTGSVIIPYSGSGSANAFSVDVSGSTGFNIGTSGGAVAVQIGSSTCTNPTGFSATAKLCENESYSSTSGANLATQNLTSKLTGTTNSDLIYNDISELADTTTSTGNTLGGFFADGTLTTNTSSTINSFIAKVNSNQPGNFLQFVSGGTTEMQVTNNGALALVGGLASDIDTLTATSLKIGASTTNALTLSNAGATTTINGSSLTITPTSWTSTPTISGLITAAGGLTVSSGKNLTLADSSFTTNNNTVLSANGSGVVTPITTTNTGYCLTSNGTGAAPSWQACAGSGTQNFWQSVSGALSPLSETQDLLLGSTATTSAKFAFTGVDGGTPTASISANTANNSTYLAGTGILGTTDSQTLQLGAAGTGNILIDSPTALSLNTVNNKAITTGNGLTTLGGNLTINGATGISLGGTNAGISFTSGTNIISATGTLQINAFQLGGTENANNNTISAINTASFGSNNLSISGTTLQTTSGTNNITITPNSTGNIVLTSTYQSGVLIGSGSNTLAPLSVSGGIGNNSAFIVNNTNNGNLITASASGATKFNVTNAGALNVVGGLGSDIDTLTATSLKIGASTTNALTLSNASATTTINGSSISLVSGSTFSTNNNSVLYTGASGVLGAATTINTGYCLLSNGSGAAPSWQPCTGSGTQNFWQRAAGAVSPVSITDDLLLGGTSTASAKFAFINNAAGSPTASISGNLSLVTPTGANPAATFNLLNGGSLNFQTSPGGDAGLATRLFIGNNGNLGIGTISPTSLFSVGSGSPFQVNATGAIAAATGITSSGTINFSGLGSSAFVVTDGSKNLTTTAGSATSAELASILSDETGTGVAVFGTSPIFTTSIDGGAGTFGLLATPTTINFGAAASAINEGASGGTITVGNGGASTLTTSTNGNLSLTAAGTGNLTLSSDFNSSVFVGNATTPAPLSVSGGIGNNAAFIVNNTNNGNLITASASGATKFNVTNAGALNVVGGLASDIDTLSAGSLTIGGTTATSINLGNASAVTTAIGGLTVSSGKNLTLAGITGNNAILYATTGTGVVTSAVTSSANQCLLSGAGAGFAPTWGSCATGTTNYWQLTGNVINPATPTNSLGIGTTTTLASSLDVRALNATQSVASISGSSNFANLVVDQTGSGDLFTASKSGATKFTILNNGNVQINNLATGVVQSSSTGLLSSSALNLAGGATLISGILPSANGGTGADLHLAAIGTIPYFSSTGVMSALVAGSAGQCLEGNGAATPVWATCAQGTNLWQENLGALAPANITDDLLLGGTATTSAKFAFINNAGGTPVASISAVSTPNSIFMDANGNISTTSRQSLTIGNSATYNTSGNILLNPNGVGNVGIGTTTPNALLQVAGTASVSGQLTVYGTPQIQSTAYQTLTLGGTTTGNVLLSPGGSGQVQFFNANNFLTSAGALTLAGTGNALNLSGNGANINFSGTGTGEIVTAANQNLALLPGGTGDVGINVSSGLLGTLDVRGNLGTTSVATISGNTAAPALLVDQSGSGTVFAASTSGLPLFTVKQNGQVVAGSLTNFNATLSQAGTYKFLVSGPANTDTRMGITAGGAAGIFYGTDGQTARFYGYNYATSTPLPLDLNEFGGGIVTGLHTVPLASFDVRGTSGTTAVASVSGQTAFAGLVVDNSGSGDLFTASSSGLTRFVVTQNGNVGIGTNTPGAALDVNGSVLLGANSTIDTRASGTLTIGNGANTTGLTLGKSGATTTFNSTTWTATPTISGLITDTTGIALGTTPAAAGILRIPNNTFITARNAANSADINLIKIDASNLVSFGANTAAFTLGGAITGNGQNITGLSALSATGTVTFSNGTFTGNNAVIFGTAGSGQLAAAVTSTANQCLISGPSAGFTPIWGSCATGTTNYWQLTGNVINPATPTNSLGIGTTTTLASSLDVRALNATQSVASISGSSNFANLVVDQTGSGDLFTASKSGATKFVITNAGNVGIGTNIPTNTLSVSGTLGVTGAATVGTLNGLTVTSNGTNTLTIAGGKTLTDNNNLTFAGTDGKTLTTNASLTLAGTDGKTLSLAGNLTTSGANDITFTGAGGGSSVTLPASGTLATLAGSETLTNKTFTDNTTLFQDDLDNTKKLAFQLSGITTGNTRTLTIPDASGTICLQSSVSCGFALGTNYWQLTGNVINPATPTNSLGIGTTTTLASSLDVRALNATQAVASISGSSNFANLVVDQTGSGDLFTASKSGATKFVITNAGNVGIGTNIPTNTLSVSGTLGVTGAATVGTLNGLTVTSNGTNTLTIAGGKTLTDNNNLTFAGTDGKTLTTNASLTLAGTDGKTLSLAGNLTTSGANDITFTGAGGGSSVTLPASGTLATLAGSETLTNKTFTDNTTLFQDDLDNTKKLAFQLSGITTGNTRTLTIPDASGTICLQSSVSCGFALGTNYWQLTGNVINPATPTNSLGIGTTTTLASSLDVRALNATQAVASISGSSNFANLVVDQTGSGDLFTASKSGATKFVITNAGNVGIGTNIPTNTLSVSGTLGVTGAATVGTLNGLTVTSNGTNTLTIAGGKTLTDNNNLTFAGTDGKTLTTNASLTLAGTDGKTLSLAGNLTTSGANDITFTGAGGGSSVTLPASGTLATLAGSETLTNKTFTDNTTLFQDDLDNTKKLAFQLSGITTGNTRTLTIPDASGTICLQSSVSCGFALGTNYWQLTGNVINPATPTNSLGIGTTTTLASSLDVRALNATQAVASISGSSNFANLVVDQTGSGDLFTASKSGATKFVITNAGNVGIGTNIPTNTLSVSGTLGVTGAATVGTLNGLTVTSNGTNTLTIAGGKTLTDNNNLTFAGTDGKTLTTNASLTLAGTDGKTLSLAGNLTTSGANDITFTGAGGGSSVTLPASGTLATLAGSETLTNKTFTDNTTLFQDDLDNTKKLAFQLSGITTGNTRTLTIPDASGTICLQSSVSCGFALGTNYWQLTGNVINPATPTNSLGIGTTTTLASSLDVRALNATQSVASISGSSNFANLVVDQTGSGDLFTASKSGATKFTINNNGNIAATGTISGLTGLSSSGTIAFSGLGASSFIVTNGSSQLTTTAGSATSSELASMLSDETGTGVAVFGTTPVFTTNITTPITYGGSGASSTLTLAGSSNGSPSNAYVLLNPTGQGGVGIGTTTPLATLDVRGNSGTTPVASVSGKTSFAGLVVDNSGSGDLFSASQSGSTKFVINNNGNIAFAGTSNFLTTFTSAETAAARTLTFPNTPGNDTVCLLTLGNCSGGATQNFWQMPNPGVIAPFSTTADLLVGGTATASADFAVSGIDSTTPIASISAFTNSGNKNGISLNASLSTIQALNLNNLTLGGATTGNITLGSNLAAATNNISNVGTLDLGSGNLSLHANTITSGTTLTLSGATTLTTGLTTLTTGGNLSMASTNNVTYSGTAALIGGTGTGSTLTLESTSGAGATDFIAFKTGSAAEHMRIDSKGNVGIGSNFGTVAATATLDVRGNSATTAVASVSGATNFAGLVVNNSGSGDIFTASAGGSTRFTVKNSGVVVIGNNTNGIQFDPTFSTTCGGIVAVYCGTARPTKQIVLSPEYAGAVLTASNSATFNGFMTANASQSATSPYNFENYYQWSSNQSALNDYTVAVTVTLPEDFSAWTPSSAVTIDYNTALATPADNALDVYIYRKGVATSVPVYFSTNNATAQKTWTQITISAAQLGGSTVWNAAGQQAVIYLKMHAMNTVNYVQVGDIKLNYLSAF